MNDDKLIEKVTLERINITNIGIEALSNSLSSLIINNVPQQTILVLGVTGSGKSTFINGLTGSKLNESSSKKSCTKDISKVISGPITWIDTPGILDTDEPQQSFLDNLFDELVSLKIVNRVVIMIGSSRRFNMGEQDSIRQYLQMIGTKKENELLFINSGSMTIDDEDDLTIMIEKICKFFGCKFKLTYYDMTEVSKINIINLIKEKTTAFQSAAFKKLVNATNQVKELEIAKELMQKEINKVKEHHESQLKLTQQRLDELSKMNEKGNLEKDKELFKLKEELEKTRIVKEEELKELMNEFRENKLELMREIDRVRSSDVKVFVSGKCGVMTKKGKPCQNSANCHWHR